jgi:hypothetical protein
MSVHPVRCSGQPNIKSRHGFQADLLLIADTLALILNAVGYCVLFSNTGIPANTRQMHQYLSQSHCTKKSNKGWAEC